MMMTLRIKKEEAIPKNIDAMKYPKTTSETRKKSNKEIVIKIAAQHLCADWL